MGFLHVPLRNRPSLALDLLEPVRPWIDEWLWQQVQKGLLTPKQFTFSKEDGCRLDALGRKAFFSAWYDEAESWLRRYVIA
ncbi:CRISPR-associated endonuclease Cas1 [Candidatus Parabeggiatoa sp. HSG14]|uniref:CRISPR-associated endonuclease Cas1 n=1 Tax=Candidatus Parabeggiatoa sp. HSG14 TaxID=3055593 RepID=UPI0025A7AD1B|nr:CRISPR-associated endonuclease Cas1 [Thiotrichales bacterium HSG14]